MSNAFTVAVKPLYVARKIAAVLRHHGAEEAATAYLRGFELRESIENAARDSVLGIKA